MGSNAQGLEGSEFSGRGLWNVGYNLPHQSVCLLHSANALRPSTLCIVRLAFRLPRLRDRLASAFSILLVLLAVTSAGAGDAGGIGEYLKKADDLKNQQEIAEAVKILNAAIEKFPDDPKLPDAYLRRAEFLTSDKRLEEAGDAFLAFAGRFRQHPRVANSLRRAALLYAQAGNWGRARETYERLLDGLKSEHSEGWANEVAACCNELGGQSRTQNRPGDAIAVYESTLLKCPEIRSKPNILRDLAGWYQKIGDLQKAEAALQRLIDDFPPKEDGTATPGVWGAWDLGHLCERHGRFDKAAECFDLVLTKYPKTGEADNLRRTPERIGWLYEKAGNARKAFDAYTAAGLSARANALGPQLDKLAWSVTCENAYAPQLPRFTIRFSNSFAATKRVETKIEIARIPESKVRTSKSEVKARAQEDAKPVILLAEKKVVELPGGSILDVIPDLPRDQNESALGFDGRHRYVMTVEALGETKRAIASLGGTDVVPLKPTWKSAATILACDAALISGDVKLGKEELVCQAPTGMISPGNYAEYRLEAREEMVISFHPVVEGKGNVRLALDGKAGERQLLAPGLYTLRAKFQGEVALRSVEVELWWRKEKPLRKTQELATDGVRIIKTRGVKTYRAMTGEATVDLLVPSEKDVAYHLDFAAPPNTSPMAPLAYEFEMHPGVLGKDVRQDEMNATYSPVFCRAGAEGSQGSFLPPLPLRSGNNRLRIRIPGGQSLAGLSLVPCLPDIEVKASCANAGNLFTPDETVSVVLRLTNKGAVAVQLSGKCRLQLLRLASANEGEFADRGFKYRNYVAEPLGELEIQPVGIAAGGTVEVPLSFKPSKMGCIALVVRLSDGSRVYESHVTNVAVVFPVADEWKPDSPFMISGGQGKAVIPRLPLYKKLGLNWSRTEIQWGAFEREKGNFVWDEWDAFFDACRKTKIYIMNLAEGTPSWARPQSKDLLVIPYKDYRIVTDEAPAREHLDDWENAWRQFLTRYKDVVRSVNMWNEPWEGGGISGWMSTGEHYRQLLDRVHKAARSVDPTITVVAADSSHNTDWKIFSAGMEDKIDVISTHYEPFYGSFSFAAAKHYKKRVWETETWTTQEGDMLAIRRALVALASGAEKVSYWIYEHIFDPGQGYPTPTAAVTSALCHFIEDTKFIKTVNPQSSPFIFLFAGKDKAVAALLSNIGEKQLRGQVGATEAVTLEVTDPRRAYQPFDILGNPTGERRGDSLLIPVGREATYLQTTAAELAAFEKALASAHINGMKPCQITLYDLDAPVEKLPPLRVKIENAYNIPISGKVKVSVPETLKLEEAEQSFKDLASGTVREFLFPIARAKAHPLNKYPVRATVETEKGTSDLAETISVATIARGTPVVDGDLAEWASLGSSPVYSASAEQSLATMIAWYPWEKWMEEHGSEFSARVAFLYDDRCLYFSADVNDPTRDVTPSLLSGKNLHKFQLPPADYVYVEAGPGTTGCGADAFLLSLGNVTKEKQDTKYESYPPSHPLYRLNPFIPTPYQYSIYPTEDGCEIMRLRTPNFYWLHPLPLNYQWMHDHCRVADAKVVVKRTDRGWLYEAGIPWTELEEIRPEPGKRIRLSFKINQGNPGNYICWSANRSVAKPATLSFEPSWWTSWSAETEWAFGR